MGADMGADVGSDDNEPYGDSKFLAVRDSTIKNLRSSEKDTKHKIIEKMLTLQHNMKYNRHLLSVYMKAKELFDKMVEEHRMQIHSLEEIYHHLNDLIRENLSAKRIKSKKDAAGVTSSTMTELMKDKKRIGALLKKMRDSYEKLMNVDTVIGVTIQQINEITFMDDEDGERGEGNDTDGQDEDETEGDDTDGQEEDETEGDDTEDDDTEGAEGEDDDTEDDDAEGTEGEDGDEDDEDDDEEEDEDDDEEETEEDYEDEDDDTEDDEGAEGAEGAEDDEGADDAEDDEDDADGELEEEEDDDDDEDDEETEEDEDDDTEDDDTEDDDRQSKDNKFISVF
jgi:hypothetical protein